MAIKVIAAIQSLLYLISSVLFVPVVVSLLVLFLWVLYEAGRTLGEYVSRRSGKGSSIMDSYAEELERTINLYGLDEARAEALLRRWEGLLQKDLDRLRVMVRISPSLGLMGTLIPMSTGLASLSRGDVQQLISSLIVALTTTVVGLAVAVIAYILGSIRQRWVEEELTLIELHTEKVFENAAIHEEEKKGRVLQN